MDDEAAFLATFAGMSSLTDGDYTVRFHVSGPNIKKLFDILTHGDKPSIAKGTWFAIARLNRGAALDGQSITPPDHNASLHGSSAQGPQLARPSPGRSLSQRAALLCNDPQFRLFLERIYLPSGNYCNNSETAAEIVRLQCGVKSRADIIIGTPAADKFDRIIASFTVWKHADKYVEAPRIQQENQA